MSAELAVGPSKVKSADLAVWWHLMTQSKCSML